jgi:hypothetical protein
VRSPLSDLLHQPFENLRVGPTRIAWSKKLEVDQATLSRVLNGDMTLTPKRAADWAAVLFRNDAATAAAFAEQMLAAARETQELRQRVREAASSGVATTPANEVERVSEASEQVPRALSVSEFFEDIVDNGGGVTDARRITELLSALQSEDLQNVLICCEYRDLPRAGPDARYEYVATAVGNAIAAGVSFAMFQPFGGDIPLPSDDKPDTPALNAAIYMTQIRTKCIDAYKLFRDEAIAAFAKTNVVKKPDALMILKEDGARIEAERVLITSLCQQLNASVDDILISSRLQLYTRSPNGGAHLGSGFQARMFYIRYTTKADHINHVRIMQWVSTPRRDLLVYRGQEEVTPDALKDSFYPIPHFFDSPVGRIPFKIDDKDHGGPGVRKYLKDKPGGEGLPAVKGAKSVWDPYD